MRKIIILLIICNAFNVCAQNNAIFYGGEGDGWSKSTYMQAAAITAYNGGEGDGWNMSSHLPAYNNTPNQGGEGDGWHAGSYLQQHSNTPNQGGEGDGWAGNNYVPAISQILYLGGEGDGWASNVIPLGPLPVELLSFTGKELNHTHVLDWATSMELNSSHFVVEHSVDAANFSELGMVTAAGNSSVKSKYTFTNRKPQMGNNFYRLKMIDIDQQYKYSNVVLLRLLKDDRSLMIYPNPAANVLNIEMSGMEDGRKLHLEIMDAGGKKIRSEDYLYDSQKHAIDISAYSNGLYFLKISGDDYAELIKFSISK